MEHGIVELTRRELKELLHLAFWTGATVQQTKVHIQGELNHPMPDLDTLMAQADGYIRQLNPRLEDFGLGSEDLMTE